MTVSMSNRIMKSQKIKTSLIKKAKPISILIPTDQIDYNNIKTGLMPNFIHSLDASNIHLLIHYLHKLDINHINLYTIHDCFASDYKNIGTIELLVKHSFVDLYFRKNYLDSIHDSFIKQIEQITEVFTEKLDNDEIIQYILIPKNDKDIGNYNMSNYTKIVLPKLPDYN
jgi:DNA-directed RNA polymerase